MNQPIEYFQLNLKKVLKELKSEGFTARSCRHLDFIFYAMLCVYDFKTKAKDRHSPCLIVVIMLFLNIKKRRVKISPFFVSKLLF